MKLQSYMTQDWEYRKIITNKLDVFQDLVASKRIYKRSNKIYLVLLEIFMYIRVMKERYKAFYCTITNKYDLQILPKVHTEPYQHGALGDYFDAINHYDFFSKPMSQIQNEQHDIMFIANLFLHSLVYAYSHSDKLIFITSDKYVNTKLFVFKVMTISNIIQDFIKKNDCFISGASVSTIRGSGIRFCECSICMKEKQKLLNARIAKK